MNDETIKTIFFSLIAILAVLQLYNFRHNIKHSVREIWYGKTRYQKIKTVLYTRPIFNKWSHSEVHAYLRTIDDLKRENFQFKGFIREAVMGKFGDMLGQNFTFVLPVKINL